MLKRHPKNDEYKNKYSWFWYSGKFYYSFYLPASFYSILWQSIYLEVIKVNRFNQYSLIRTTVSLGKMKKILIYCQSSSLKLLLSRCFRKMVLYFVQRSLGISSFMPNVSVASYIYIFPKQKFSFLAKKSTYAIMLLNS